MRRRAIASMLGLVLAGCTPLPPAEPSAPRPRSPSSIVQAPPAPAPSPVKDSCGAAELQGLVGRPKTEIPVPIYPDRQRVACTTCPITRDYRPERLDFFFDEATGLIREIRCG